MLDIKFGVFFTKSLGTLYKDNSITVLGKEANVDIDLKEVSSIYANYKVGENSFTDLVEMVDINKGLIRIPFKSDVLKVGVNRLELVATMKNGNVKPSQTFTYAVDKSLENPNSVEAETNYPILIELLKEVDNSIKKLDTHWEEKEVEIDEKFKVIDESLKEIVDAEAILNNALEDLKDYKDTTTNELDNDLSQYKTNTTRELKEDFNRYSSEATLNLNEELDSKFTTKSEEITKTLNDEIDKVNASLNSKINEVDEIVEEVELSEQARKEEHEELINELSTYADDINNVKDKFNDFEDRIDTLETKITNNEVVVDLKAKVNEHETRLDVLEENAVNNTRIDNLENKVNILEPKVLQNEKDIKNQGILIDALFDLTETISITEEGNAISLPQSKEGKIVIDELQGNTLVNYCKNGSEELTLNNEINVQGTDVTLTDTFEGGKVDVILEGNTLILDEEGNEVEAGTEGARLVSVGELEDNKIEIVSKSKNLLNINDIVLLSDTDTTNLATTYEIINNNTIIFNCLYSYNQIKLRIKMDTHKLNNVKGSGTVYAFTEGSWIEIPMPKFGIMDGFIYGDFVYKWKPITQLKIINFQIEEGTQATSYVPYATNTHSIQLSEPLRALPNGVCDKFVKQGVKWYVERNCGIREYQEGDLELSNTLTDTKNTVYQLDKPTYEEITDPQVITYLDTTHISTNSTIPCNMQIKNSGYNAIIKPSTQYTVAFDTDTSGEVGINLGGAKVTATNNVATITTPSTLTDDTLRLYGKGVKASKVRLLEGDKTNCVPSYFEGMKSCFEDKLQEDGTYKMEILSNNKNLFNGTWVYDEGKNKINSGDLIKVKPNTTYTISDNLKYRYQIYEYTDNKTHFNSIYPYAGSYTFTTSKRTYYLRFSTYAPSTDVNVKFLLEEGRNVNSYEPNKSNSIQLQLSEPLRAVGDVKDRFVLKDGKLMIERNCGAREYQEGDYELSNVLTDSVNTIYILDTPTYEDVDYNLRKIILEGYDNGTLFFDTNIPPTSTITYSANIPVVSKLNKVNEVSEINTEDIAITQMAVDFLLMSSIGEEMINFKIKGGTNMSAYFASRIIKGALKYEDVISKYPNYKEDIDLILIAEGYSDLIVEL